jgi:crotonobetainyl-CoA:carnitine CoA-transferase CaiB-like acyl-CoA transferase
VPQSFEASDGYFILAVGNDSQFAKFCATAGKPELAADPRFITNAKYALALSSPLSHKC